MPPGRAMVIQYAPIQHVASTQEEAESRCGMKQK